MSAKDLLLLPDSRYTEDFILDYRNGQAQRMSDWKSACITRLQEYGGELLLGTYPDGTPITQNNVQNQVHDNAQRFAQDAAANRPTLIIDVIGKPSNAKAAGLRHAIGLGYRLHDSLDMHTEQLAIDLVLSGTAWLLSYAKEGAEYPCHLPLKPLGVYPTFYGNQLVDLVYEEEKNQRAVAAMYGQYEIEQYPQYNANGMLKIVNFWNGQEYHRVLEFPAKGRQIPAKGYKVESKPNPIGRVPVSFSMLTSGKPGEFEDLLASVGPMVRNGNMIFSLMMEAGIRGVFGGYQDKGVLNDEGGPGATLELDTNVPDAGRRPIPAPEMPRELPYLLSHIEESARNAGAYPAQIGGGNLPSIISAKGIQATRGERDTVVASLQRHLAFIWRNQTEIDFAIDEKVLDMRKDLLVPAGPDDTTYMPSKAIGGKYRCRVEYENDGMDPYNHETLNITRLGNRIISRRKAMEMSPAVQNVDQEMDRQYQEMGLDILLQRFFASGDIPGLDAFEGAKEEGKTNREALRIGMAAMGQPLMPLNGQAPQPQPGQGAAEQALAVEKGALGQQGPAAPAGAASPAGAVPTSPVPGPPLPPLTQVLSGRPA